jgi:hypothetical protein
MYILKEESSPPDKPKTQTPESPISCPSRRYSIGGIV